MPAVNADPHADGYIFQPTHCVTALFAPGTDMVEVRLAILEQGYEDREVHVLQGEQGAAQYDLKAEHQGMFTRLRRGIDQVLSEQLEVMQQAERVLKSGGGVVAIYVGGIEDETKRDAKANQAAGVLYGLGGRELWYWGQLALERMSGEPVIA